MSLDADEIFLDTGRGRLAALRTGTPGGPKVLALHGWLDNAASFVPLMPHLQALDLVALDLPGHGASEHRAAGYDYAFVDWLHDVLDALDALGWQRAALLGHSLGGAIATLVAAGAPERVERLALIEALGPIAARVEEAAPRLRQAIAARRALAPAKSPRVIADLEHAVDARLAATPMSRDSARLVVARNLREVPGGVSWRSDPRLRLPSHVRSDEATVRHWIAAIEAPVLLIAAEPAPPYFPPEVRAGRLATLRDARLVTLPGSHHLHMEQPAAVAAAVGPFLAG